MAKLVRAYIGLGANVGDPQASLEHAVRALAALPGVRLSAVSPLYQTKPVGGVQQPDFLNAVVALEVPAGQDPETGALALLAALKNIEHALGRQRRGRWGPREIDLDLLLFGRRRIDRPELQVPHREMRERLFVLGPLADLAPGLRPPGWRKSVAAVAAGRSVDESADAVVHVADWDPDAGGWRPARSATVGQ